MTDTAVWALILTACTVAGILVGYFLAEFAHRPRYRPVDPKILDDAMRSAMRGARRR